MEGSPLKDIYCEAHVAYRQEGFAMVKAGQRNNRIAQSGSAIISHRLPHGQRILFPQAASLLGRRQPSYHGLAVAPRSIRRLLISGDFGCGWWI